VDPLFGKLSVDREANMSIAGTLFNPAQIDVDSTPYKRQSD
jgi:hypothetical protein